MHLAMYCKAGSEYVEIAEVKPHSPWPPVYAGGGFNDTRIEREIGSITHKLLAASTKGATIVASDIVDGNLARKGRYRRAFEPTDYGSPEVQHQTWPDVSWLQALST